MSDQNNNMPENENVQGQNSQANGQNAQNAASQSSKRLLIRGFLRFLARSVKRIRMQLYCFGLQLS